MSTITNSSIVPCTLPPGMHKRTHTDTRQLDLFHVLTTHRGGASNVRLAAAHVSTVRPYAGSLYGMSLAQLVLALIEFCAGQGLAYESADEMALRDDLTQSQRKWLHHYSTAWEAAEEREACAVALGCDGDAGVVYIGGQVYG